jgi:hypothetical protein
MRWARHVALMGEMRNVYNILVGRNLKWIDTGVDGRVILKRP